MVRALLLIGVLAVAACHTPPPPSNQQPAAPAKPGFVPGSVALAVLEAPDLSPRAAGLAYAIWDKAVETLAGTPGPRFVALTPEPGEDPRAPASRLGAEFVLTGQVVAPAGQATLRVEIRRTDSGEIVWRDEFTARGADGRITEELAAALAARLRR
jgi:TolB-like protein